MIAHFQKIDNALNPTRAFSNAWLSPLLDLLIRLYMANIFFKSGMLKFKNFLNDDWGSTVYLFQDVHPLPGIPAELAATFGTAGELILPVLLALGLFGRVGALGLLVMTAVIQFIVPAEYGIMSEMHYLWMMLLGVIVLKGPGKFSLDALIAKFIRT
jgi:putative oxidoreductase